MKREKEDAAGHRHDRLEQLVLEELRALVRDDITDPRLDAVRLNAVRLSVDYRHARVHFALVSSRAAAPISRSELRAVEQSLARAAPFLRARLGDAIEMKRVPDLRFVADPAPVQRVDSVASSDVDDGEPR